MRKRKSITEYTKEELYVELQICDVTINLLKQEISDLKELARCMGVSRINYGIINNNGLN